MGGPERYQLSPENLEKEARYIESSEKGIVWNFDRKGKHLPSRIFYGWVGSKLELFSFDPKEPRVPRQPEPEEMFQFVQLVYHVVPESSFIEFLRVEVIAQLRDRREELGKMIAESSLTEFLRVEVAPRLRDRIDELGKMIDEINVQAKQESKDTSIPHQ